MNYLFMHLCKKCFAICIFLQIFQFVSFSKYVHLFIYIYLIILLSYKDIMRIMFNNKAEKL